MDNSQTAAIKEAAKAYLEAKQMSRADLARTLNVSETAISQIFNDKYQGDSDKLWRAIARLIGFNMGGNWVVRKTQNLRAIQEMCTDAQHASKFLALSAETDKGKTTGLEYYKRKGINVYYVLCDVNMQRKEFINAVLRSMGQNTEGSISERMNRIVACLLASTSKFNGIKPLLILDDVGKLSDHCLRQIQVIYDRTESNMERHVGLVIAGTDYMEKYINKMADKDKMGFRELRRRIEYWQPLTGVSLDFIAAIATDFGITDKPALQLLQGIATGYGVLKNLLQNYERFILEQPDRAKDMSQREILHSLTHKAA
jgi:DNA transposition AAA+ family ATPase